MGRVVGRIGRSERSGRVGVRVGGGRWRQVAGWVVGGPHVGGGKRVIEGVAALGDGAKREVGEEGGGVVPGDGRLPAVGGGGSMGGNGGHGC